MTPRRREAFAQAARLNPKLLIHIAAASDTVPATVGRYLFTDKTLRDSTKARIERAIDGAPSPAEWLKTG